MSHVLNEITVLPFYEIIDATIQGLGKLGKMPGHSVSVTQHYSALRSSIQRANGELLVATTRDEIAAAGARLNLLREEERKILDRVKDAAVEHLLRGHYICLAYLDGEKVVVPPTEFAGEMDWENECLRSGEVTYRKLRVVHGGRITSEQEAELLRQATRTKDGSTASVYDAPPSSSGAPGRPTSMHLVETEFRRRAEENLTAPTLKDEADILAAWLRRSHPNAPKASTKTIKNRLRVAYRDLARHKPIPSA